MAKPYHIKLKRTTKNLSDTQVQNYSDLKWGEPVLTNDGYMVVGDKSTDTPDADNPDNYQSHAISSLKVLKLLPKVIVETISSVQHYIYNRFTFYKAGSNNPAAGTHVTLLKLNSAENGVDVILPDTEAGYVGYTSSKTDYPTNTVGANLHTAEVNIGNKADKSTTVTNVAYANSKFTKTINGASSDIVTASTLKTDMGLNNVTNESKTTMFTNPAFTGTATVGGKTIATVDDVNNKIQIIDSNWPPSSPVDGVIYIRKMTATSGGNTYIEYVPYIYHGSTWIPLSAVW